MLINIIVKSSTKFASSGRDKTAAGFSRLVEKKIGDFTPPANFD
jgi:hypothetical protein